MSVFRHLLLILTLFSVQLTAFADCTNVDLRSKFGPVRNQDGVGWCYAYAAADYMEYFTGERYSPADLAALYYRNNEKDIQKAIDEKKPINEILSGGNFEQIIDFAKAQGACLESDAPTNDFSWVEANPKGSLRIIDILKSFDTLAKNREKILANVDAEENCKMISTSMAFQPSFDMDEMIDIIKNNRKAHSIFLKTMLKACDGKRHIPKNAPSVNGYTYPSFSIKTLIDGIDKVLAREKPEPILIDYYSGFLQDKNKFGNKDVGHASLIIGSRKNERGECEYLLRNSWGRGCDQYDATYVTCEEGNLWISKSTLEKHLYQVRYSSKGFLGLF